tara:strand:- start:246 stop:569 length:324 start_codon:yes stop_codon:yes gene_type:complete
MGLKVEDTSAGKPLEPGTAGIEEKKAMAKAALEALIESGKLQDAIKAAPNDGGIKSRKLWLAIGASVAIVAGIAWLGLNPDLGYGGIVALVSAYFAANTSAKKAGIK